METVNCKFCYKSIPKYKLCHQSNGKTRRLSVISEYCNQECFYKNRGKTKLNDDFLSFNLPEYAYLAGFIWADGYIGTHQIAVEFVKDDAETIKWIFEKSGNWKYSERQRALNLQRTACFKISTKDTCQKLLNLDYGQKSLMSADKVWNQIPKINQHYFLRGFSDGDGHWNVRYKPIDRSFVLGGSANQDWSWLFKIFKQINVNNYIYRQVQDKKGKGSTVIIHTNNDIQNYSEYLYQGNTNIGFPRKFQKCLECLRSCKRPPIKSYLLYH